MVSFVFFLALLLIRFGAVLDFTFLKLCLNL